MVFIWTKCFYSKFLLLAILALKTVWSHLMSVISEILTIINYQRWYTGILHILFASMYLYEGHSLMLKNLGNNIKISFHLQFPSVFKLIHAVFILWMIKLSQQSISLMIPTIHEVWVLRPVQQPGSYWDRSSELPLVGLEPTEVTAYD